MGAELVIAGTGVAKMRELGIALKGADKTLRLELGAAVRAAANPIVSDVRAAVMGIPVGGAHGGGLVARAAFATRRPRAGHGLRATIAAATGLRVRTTGKASGVQIRVNVARLPTDQRKLPRDLDSPSGWRHPVFGDTKTWVAQAGHPYFKVTIARHAPMVRARIETAMDVIALKLSR